MESGDFDNPYKPLADMFGNAGGGSSYMSNYPLTTTDYTDPDLLAEEQYQENLKKRMEEVQQDMKSFGIDGYNGNAPPPADPSLTPQPSSSNEDFDPAKNY